MANVQGVDNYKVTLYFDKDDELISNCSCPYEGGGVCKHIVSVILSLSNINIVSNNKTKSKENIFDLVSKLNLKDAQEFITEVILKKPEVVIDLKVFVQGQKESSKIEEDYYIKFKNELSQIGPESLLESFHFFEQQYDYDDYWDNDGDSDTDNRLSEWVDEVVDLVSKYFNNNNFKEALKIYFSAIQAYFERGFELEKKYIELGDWIEEAGNKLLGQMNTYLEKLPKEHFEFTVRSLIRLIKLQSLKSHKSDLLFCTGNLYFKFEDVVSLKKLVEKYIAFYPPISLNLLTFLKKTSKFKELHSLSERALLLIPKEKDFFSFKPDNYYDREDFEIKVRCLLIGTFEPRFDYKLLIYNLERLFEISKEIKDYRLLREEYKSSEEKNIYLEKIEKLFSKNNHIKVLFKVFRIENNKLKILNLIQKHKDAECFSEMVKFVKDQFPKECFLAYKSKINKLLEVADTEKYEAICTHLLEMGKANLNDKFTLYISEIKQKYHKRYRLMENIEKYGL
ncbi:MAG: hypothetical protein UR39_C0017G0016 [Candidatus Woesebacteria bacterium GW2011_GWA1_33_30]|uniref:SWIM-type domain-containing protein n=1 Tax=Candidatus Woesebacteria bacterium GW2011_GWA2_33_28 TaxID=1618561 RepID=A0A0F9ZNT2_9BACT|nr:MAG: hypothetical protein UR38_C0015G0015 [Candidatus Woesebacteria bacterium GW2011_GWA2_33_28]KKP46350.1 MAG: hypothetical protein UR39_C0017G0016 [Candidatus Woesebacteria bacterium GW2011_GWA1_33_30]KKP47844.1 MAG: hypothetical protein UR40_C0017G0015 [Microgenomates group bacterium GW2011_GWC1_33_32]KKP51282.1 MAG: hypothetical protein UR44_C0014G0015 [Candidatus Woesebacteria bacterium GW2011_GWB1_33_38]KKP55750.1 MAG: hypothetical protein UR48_C0052G0004 [Microgenomates group bacteriu